MRRSSCSRRSAAAARSPPATTRATVPHPPVPRPLPADLTRTLARESGTQRRVGTYRAPSGCYWRHRHAASLDLTDIRTLMGDYELAACPTAIVPPGDAAPLPPPR